MEGRGDREAVMKPLRQIGMAIALVVVLYGILLILDTLFNMWPLGAYVSHYLWLFYQIVVAVLIIFVGAKLYVIVKTIKVVDLRWMTRRGSMRNLALLGGGYKRKMLPLIFLSIILVPIVFSALNIYLVPRDLAISIARSCVTSSQNYRENNGFDLKLWGIGQVSTPWGPAWRTIWSYYTSHVGMLMMVGEFAVTVDVHGVTGFVIDYKVHGTGAWGVIISSGSAIFYAKQHMAQLYEIPSVEIDFIHASSIEEIYGLKPGWLMNFTFHDLDLGTVFVDIWEGLTITREGTPSSGIPNNTVSLLGAVQISAWNYLWRKGVGGGWFFERAWLEKNNSMYIWHVQWNYLADYITGEEPEFTLIRSVISIEGRYGEVLGERILQTSKITRSELEQRFREQSEYGEWSSYNAVEISARTEAAKQYIRLKNISVTLQPAVYNDKKCWVVIYTFQPTEDIVLQIYVDLWTYPGKVIALIP